MKNITPEMLTHYYSRTFSHICKVQFFAVELVRKFPETGDLLQLVKFHDESKFLSKQFLPYVKATWGARLRKEGVEPPSYLFDGFDEAKFNHITSERHHPEANDPNYTLEKMLKVEVADGKSMSDLHIAEMCCDWAAMGLEMGNSSLQWFNDNLDVRWSFKNEQITLIRKYCEYLDSVEGLTEL